MLRAGWQLRIRHVTGYRYDGEVTTSYNEVRLSPRSTGQQVVLDSRVEVTPAVNLFGYHDYFGSIVHAFDIHTPHTELVVTGTSVVETSGIRPLGPEVAWDDVDEVADTWREYLLPTIFVPSDLEIADEASRARAEHSDPREAVLAAMARVRERLIYEPGWTTVSTTAPEAWARARGVCQDFAHVSLALLRHMGVPARYVSGYLHPRADGEVGELIAGESHAWVEAWVGEWEAFDATGEEPAVGARHVVVARGRDYGDVPPLKGIFTGASSPAPHVTVELVRTA